MVVSHLADDVTAGTLLDEVVGPEMDKRWMQLEAKLQELMTPYQKGHPITYNHYFTETIQNVRDRRMEEERNETDMDYYASSDILDCMMAFYKKLKELLSPSRIMKMDGELLQRIAAESTSAVAQRELLSRKL
ncbi:hypothetical protein NEMBOFW57_008810 [Staphylotrichum longicolle]|uniref:Uncharacterized protein n=1 Tax=Staphylotrichum longicolle TaxID=669026 RepID=A0AAD4ES32_9PEZI|nr:hypothetical protein NEMBOFW57_008810 [Staphylotrichum longicolle]